MARKLGWLPPLTMFALDVALTLRGQPAEYWAGDYSRAVEANPLAWLILAVHPYLFLGLAIGWAVAFVALVTLWEHRLAKVVAFVLTVGHAVGAASWLLRLGWPGVAAAVGLMVAAERLLTWCWPRTQ